MARKTSRHIKPKAKPPSREELLDRMARPVEERFPNYQVRAGQTKTGKVSARFLAFLEPYLEEVNDDAYEKLITVGLTAWNIALMPPGRTDDLIDQVINSWPAQLQEDFLDTLQRMIQRKQRLFADDQQCIIDYQLTDVNGQWQLSVVSTPTPEDKPDKPEDKE